ncbi:MAG: tRNA glutamyl-Q(34) synthetase GluQRS [Denitromonas halophila]|nr:MAG: tRNA glutamyl-Q(34) synthetase GluQRS [Denitromonas halophila]TVT71936.1 MAG: tRNA glutamyl-Q(34) synthetase GluQRS [Denitromonas halophila]
MMNPPSPLPVGRFAPSPSGPLHFGSVVAAVGSYLSARGAGGRWLLRIEDVDALRSMPDAAERIIATLARLGFEWDGPIVWQHARLEAYADALQSLRDQGRVYGCACTRKMLADAPRAADGSARYPGTCRAGLLPGQSARAWRFRVSPGVVRFDDDVQGPMAEDVLADVGDFVLLRADGLFAYQLAVVLDDAAAAVTEVVRGIDLLPSTARQIALQQALALPTPRYAHLPVVVDAAGQKLSKQSLARAVDELPDTQVLFDALVCLGQSPPVDLRGAPLAQIWAWAQAHWSMNAVPRRPAVNARSDYDR